MDTRETNMQQRSSQLTGLPLRVLFVRHGKDVIFANYYDSTGAWKGCDLVTKDQMREHHAQQRKETCAH